MTSNHQPEWHYAEGGRSFGPYPESEIAKLIMFGPLTSSTHVWTEDFEEWRLLGDSDLARYLPESKTVAPETTTPQDPADSDSIPRSEADPELIILQLQRLFNGLILCGLSGAALIYIAMENKWQYLGLGGVMIGAIGMVGMFGLHYKLWVLLQGRGARTTPLKAVGFLFIPIFNLYWHFVSYYGLAVDMAARCEELGFQGDENATQLGLAASVSNLVFVILNLFEMLEPNYQMISILMYLCLLAVFYRQILKDAKEIVRRQHQLESGA